MKSCYKDNILIFPRNFFFESPFKDLQYKTDIKTPTQVFGRQESREKVVKKLFVMEETHLEMTNPL